MSDSHAMPNSLLWLSNELYWRQDLSTVSRPAAPAAASRPGPAQGEAAAGERGARSKS